MTRLLSILLLAIFCASCKTEQQQVKIRRAPVPVELADIPQRSVARAVRSPESRVQSPLSVVPSPPRPMRLQWDYPQDRLWEIRNFNVYSNTGLNPLPWPLFATTTNQSIAFMPTNTARYFYCTAFGVNGTESLPNTK